MEHPEPGRLREFVCSAAWPSWQVSITGDRVRFVSAEGPRREVIWDVPEADLAAHCRAMDAVARGAIGRTAHGYHLMQVHLEETLATFDGASGRLVLTSHGLDVRLC